MRMLRVEFGKRFSGNRGSVRVVENHDRTTPSDESRKQAPFPI